MRPPKEGAASARTSAAIKDWPWHNILAAKHGIEHWGETITIADKAPVKTVCEAFGVKRTAVRNWQRTVPPEHLGANPVNAEIVTNLMKSAAERYRIAGRSEHAIDRRGRAQLA
jgi:hypothetical protein